VHSNDLLINLRIVASPVKKLALFFRHVLRNFIANRAVIIHEETELTLLTLLIRGVLQTMGNWLVDWDAFALFNIQIKFVIANRASPTGIVLFTIGG
jgi:hypothetical protein